MWNNYYLFQCFPCGNAVNNIYCVDEGSCQQEATISIHIKEACNCSVELYSLKISKCDTDLEI